MGVVDVVLLGIAVVAAVVIGVATVGVVLGPILVGWHRIRRWWRIIQRFGPDCDKDGYPVYRDSPDSFEWNYRARFGRPVYPLRHPQRESMFGEQAWCVSRLPDGQARFCDRDGNAFSVLPKRLRGEDPDDHLAGFEQQREATTS